MLASVTQFVGRYYFLLVIAAILQLVLYAHLGARGLPTADYAQIMAAVSSFAAVIAALVIAVRTEESSRRKETKRATAAAILVSQNLYMLRAALDVVYENQTLVCSDPDGYAHWLSKVMARLGEMGQVISEAHLQIVIDLPTPDLFTLAVTDSWFNTFKKKSKFRGVMTVAEVVDIFEPTIKDLVAGRRVVNPASERMFALSEVGGSPPWASNLPSWVLPERIV